MNNRIGCRQNQIRLESLARSATQPHLAELKVGQFAEHLGIQRINWSKIRVLNK